MTLSIISMAWEGENDEILQREKEGGWRKKERERKEKKEKKVSKKRERDRKSVRLCVINVVHSNAFVNNI